MSGVIPTRLTCFPVTRGARRALPCDVILNAPTHEDPGPDRFFTASGNRLLRMLPVESAATLAGRMTPVRLRQGTVLCKPGERFKVVYFPTEAIVSLMACTADTSIEVATLGAEGVVGRPPLMGRVVGAMQWTVQVDGAAWRCDASDFEDAVRGCPSMEGLLRRYEYSLMIQAVQAASCTSAHRLEQRCARWLLATHDRLPDDRVPMTHDFIAMMLSVRRAGITLALRAFQDRRIVKCRRGAIDIVDRLGLEAAACECYGIVREASNTLLGTPPFQSSDRPLGEIA